MHSRMRARVAEFLKVLNRAKMENREVERKTVTYVLGISESSFANALTGAGLWCSDKCLLRRGICNKMPFHKENINRCEPTMYKNISTLFKVSSIVGGSICECVCWTPHHPCGTKSNLLHDLSSHASLGSATTSSRRLRENDYLAFLAGSSSPPSSVDKVDEIARFVNNKYMSHRLIEVKATR